MRWAGRFRLPWKHLANPKPFHLSLLRGGARFFFFIDVSRLSQRSIQTSDARWRTVTHGYGARIRFDTSLKINPSFPCPLKSLASSREFVQTVPRREGNTSTERTRRCLHESAIYAPLIGKGFICVRSWVLLPSVFSFRGSGKQSLSQPRPCHMSLLDVVLGGWARTSATQEKVKCGVEISKQRRTNEVLSQYWCLRWRFW